MPLPSTVSVTAAMLSAFKKKILPYVFSLATALSPLKASAYSPGTMENPETHPQLTQRSVDLYVDSGVPFENERIIDEARELLKEGTIREDSPQAHYIRAYNHFTDFEESKGLWGFLSSQQWAQDSSAQSGSVPLENLGELRPLYQIILRDYSGKYPEGDHTWRKAVQERDLRSLGHILHLIQDATVPAHTRNDPHAGLPAWIIDDQTNFEDQIYAELIAGSEFHDDSYETWVKNNPKKFSFLDPQRPRRYNTLDELFEDVVTFTGSHFLSDNSTDRYEQPAASLVKRKEGRKTYYYETVEGKEIPVARKGFILNYVLDERVLQEQWKVLGTKAVEMGAAAIQLYFESIGEENPDQPECIPRERLECIDGDVYRVDGCGLQEQYQRCSDIQSCRDGRCIDNVIEECHNGEREEVRCGLNNNGAMERICRNGRWEDLDCRDPDECVLGQRREFYNGPQETAGVGECRRGLEECLTRDGRAFFVITQEEIVPGEEICGNGRDEDCDGTFIDNYRNKIVFVDGGDIYIIDPDGRNKVRVIDRRFPSGHPDFSPDGCQIAFSDDLDANLDNGRPIEVYVVNTTGSDPRGLTGGELFDGQPSWSPDGTKITYYSYFWDQNKRGEIMVMDADGANKRNITNSPTTEDSPSWSPDGRTIAFVYSNRDRYSSIRTTDIRGGNPVTLIEEDSGFQGILGPIAWSPDNRKIAFVEYTLEADISYKVAVMDANGGNKTYLTDGRNVDSYPTWSPDGRKIAFTSDRNGAGGIYIMDVDGRNVRFLTNGVMPRWSKE